MASCREILTIQLGSYGNFVGSHFWNIQEMGFDYSSKQKSEICHDVLYREGLGREGEVTFTPRTICVDHSSHLPPIPTLDEPVVEPSVLWDATRVDKVEDSSDSLHTFVQDLNAGLDVSNKDYAFETTVRSWSDILRTRLHPRSVVQGYSSFEDDLEDKIRAFVEECDNLQGFQILLDTADTFTEVLLYLDDEYSSKTRLVFPLIPGSTELNLRDSAARFLRNYLSIQDSTQSSLTVPLSCVSELTLKSDQPSLFPHLIYDLQSQYQTSAILASFIDTFTLGYRLSEDKMYMNDVVAAFSSNNWKFASASVALPFPGTPGKTTQQTLEDRDDQETLWTYLTPDSSLTDCRYQSFGLRGLSDPEVVLQYLKFLSSATTSLTSVRSPLPTLIPFPKIFSPQVSTKGSVDVSDPTAIRMPGFEVLSSPMLAGIHAGSELGDTLDGWTNTAVSIEKRRIAEVTLEYDLFLEKIESMRCFALNYAPTFDLI